MISNPASVLGRQTDTEFLVIGGICIVLLIVITFLMLYFVLRYGRGRNRAPQNITGNTPLEASFLGASIILVLFMFYYGWGGYRLLKKEVPADALEVRAVARQWVWSFRYQNGKESPTLNVPVNTPVKVILNSNDVIHGFFIPAFRTKQDVLPGTERFTWFNADGPGTYDIFCTQFCGTGHYTMLSKAVVMSGEQFNVWLASGAAPEAKAPLAAPSAGAGKALYESKGCPVCHSIDGSKKIGPTFKGLYGSKVRVTTDGREREVTADDEYIKRSELEPNADIVVGYPGSVMPPQKGVLTDAEIASIIEFLKTLK